jgi:hypothetical protein
MQDLDDYKIQDIISHLEGYGYQVFDENEEEELITEIERRGYRVLKW